MDPPVIHGDLKAVRVYYIHDTHGLIPYQEKVLIGEEGQPLITDFALAKARCVNCVRNY